MPDDGADGRQQSGAFRRIRDRRSVDVARLSRSLRGRQRRRAHPRIARHRGAGGCGGRIADVQLPDSGLGRHIERGELRLGRGLCQRHRGEPHRARHQQHDDADADDRSGPHRTHRLQHDVSRPRLEAGNAESVRICRHDDQLPCRNQTLVGGQRLSVVGETRRRRVERADRDARRTARIRRQRDLSQRHRGGERFDVDGRSDVCSFAPRSTRPFRP